MKFLRIFFISLIAISGLVFGSNAAYAETKTPEPKTYDLSYCQKVENPYSHTDSQWWQYEKTIKEYYKSCSIAPDFTSEWSGHWGDWKNGAIPPSELTFVNDEFLLKDDASKAFLKMNEAYKKETGKDLQVNDAYRPYSVQWETWLKDPSIGAYPGTSGHGWGTSLDLATAGDYEAQGKWLKANSEKYGWINPAWAHDGVDPEEPWHFDFKESSHPKICTDIWANDCTVL